MRQAYQPIKQRELKAGGRARVVGRTSPHCFREGGIVEVKGYDRVYGAWICWNGRLEQVVGSEDLQPLRGEG